MAKAGVSTHRSLRKSVPSRASESPPSRNWKPCATPLSPSDREKLLKRCGSKGYRAVLDVSSDPLIALFRRSSFRAICTGEMDSAQG